MAWFRNHHACPHCGTRWQNEWSCMCDDRCPNCDLSCTPVESEDLSVAVSQTDDGCFAVLRSPATAEHQPDYVTVQSFPDREKTEAAAKNLDT